MVRTLPFDSAGGRGARRIAGGCFGRWVGVRFLQGGADVDGDAPDFSKPLVQEQIRQQQVEVEHAIEEAEQNVNALALRIGEMQAHVIRLDALGGRLVDMAELDPEEFDFNAQPARGGRRDPGSLGRNLFPILSLRWRSWRDS